MELEELSVLTIGDSQNGGMLDAGSPRGMLAWTPLQFACALGDEGFVTSLLMDAKSFALDIGKNGTTPLDVAKELGYTELSQLLTDHVKKASGKAQIGNWLASIGMVEYTTNFQDAGFDDAAFLLANGLSDPALDAMKIEKPGHRMKLQGLYQLKESIPDLNDDEEEEVSGSDSDDEDDEKSGSSAEDSDESGSEGSESEEDSNEGDSSE